MASSDDRPTTPRARARERTMADIVRIANRHLAADGAAGLSLRAVARELGVVSSALYRYVANRDELLTLLVIDGYTGLAAAVDAAEVAAGDVAPLERCRAIARAFRDWGLAEPARYALLFGTPVPGYDAPADTIAVGTQVAARLLAAVRDGVADGSVRVGGEVGPALATQLAAVRATPPIGIATEIPDAVLARGLGLWSQLVGATSLEVFGWYGEGTFTDPEAVFDELVDQHLRALGSGR